MINVKLSNEELEDMKKKPMETKQALSMQETLRNALRLPTAQNQQITQPTTVNGFGRSV